MRMAPVTAVIPCYNSGALLAQAVQSVLAQTVVPEQIVVVDDGSSDGTWERLGRYRARVHYILHPNQGVSSARNHGIAAARNELIAFLDADDIWHPRKIEIQLDALIRHPEFGLLGTDSFEWPDVCFPVVAEVLPSSLELVTWRQFVVKSPFATSTVMVRREVLSRVGCFDTDFRRAEDRDLYIRVAKVFPVAHLNLPLMGARPSLSSLSRQVPTMRDGGVNLLRKLKGDQERPVDWLLGRQALSLLDYNCANTCELAGHRFKAIGYLLKSLAGYPFCFDPGVMRTSFGRLKRLIVLLARFLLRQPPESVGKTVLRAGELDALEALRRNCAAAI